jgi:predicted Asp-tRNA(Asn)/Glu-tRNA(Gln) amidotransferase subunit C
MDPDKIKSEGVKLLEEFSDKLRDIPSNEDTHYVIDIRNVFRPEGHPTIVEGFAEKVKNLAPRYAEGFIIAEKGN